MLPSVSTITPEADNLTVQISLMKNILMETPGKSDNQEMPTWILMSIATLYMYVLKDKKWNNGMPT